MLLLRLLLVDYCCRSSLLSEDTLHFQVRFQLLLNHLILIGSEALKLFVFVLAVFPLDSQGSAGASLHDQIKCPSIGLLKVMEVNYLIFSTSSNAFRSGVFVVS